MFSTTGLLTNFTMEVEVADKAQLEQALLAAHSAGNDVRLVQLYEQAADRSEAEADTQAACFYLTHALVFALQEGLEIAELLRTRLNEYGCEDL